MAAIAPTGTVVSVERKSPIADSPSSDTVDVGGDREAAAASPSPTLTVAPERECHRPHREQEASHQRADHDDGERRDHENAAARDDFTQERQQSRTRPAGAMSR